MTPAPYRIFITGSTSFLGRSLVRALIDSYPLRLLIHKTPPPSFFSHENFQIVSGDLTTLTEEMLRNISTVVHGAAITHGSQEAYRRVNVDGTAHLLSLSRRAGVRRFIYISSRAVGQACGAYGDSKARAEELVAQSGIPFVIARSAEVYDDAFSSPEGIGKLARFIKHSPVVPFPSHPRALLAPIHINDVIEALARILSLSSMPSTIYTLAGPETLTMRDVIERIRAHFRLRRLLIPLPIKMFFMIPPEQRARLICEKNVLSENAITDLMITPRLFLI